jgi:hypothetical protein
MQFSGCVRQNDERGESQCEQSRFERLDDGLRDESHSEKLRQRKQQFRFYLLQNPPFRGRSPRFSRDCLLRPAIKSVTHKAHRHVEQISFAMAGLPNGHKLELGSIISLILASLKANFSLGCLAPRNVPLT